MDTEEHKISNTWTIWFHKIDDKRYLKKTYWYEMSYNGNEELLPQKTENITFAKWFNPDELDTVFENTFASLMHVFYKGIEK